MNSIGLALLLAGAAVMLALLSSRVSVRTRVPAPLFFLVLAAVVANAADAQPYLSTTVVQHIVTVALVLILFNGGMHIGWRRFRENAAVSLALGIPGTFLTAGAVGLVAHLGFGLGWQASLLLGAAIAPTDPAVVFSVLGQREISGRSGVLLEAESGVNDPVGIAIVASLLDAGSGGAWAVAGSTAATFAEEMVIGAAIGAAGGWALSWFIRRVALPSEGLYPLRTLASAFLLFGAADVAHGSGFLAVLVAGMMIGDGHAPYKGTITRFHDALASLGEIGAFTVLGLTVQGSAVLNDGGWVIGVVLALVALVGRPLFVGPLLLGARLSRSEKALVLYAGLKGAVPILLGSMLLTAGLKDAEKLYDALLVVVAISVLLQGGLLPYVARRLRIPMHAVEQQPWSLGIRFRSQPEGLRRVHVRAGAAADGSTIGELPLDEQVWVSLVIRSGSLVAVRGETRLEAGDEVVLLVDEEADDPTRLFRERLPADEPIGTG